MNAESEISCFLFYTIFVLVKTFITYNWTQPLTVQSEILVCYVSSGECSLDISLEQRCGAGYRSLVSSFTLLLLQTPRFFYFTSSVQSIIQLFFTHVEVLHYTSKHIFNAIITSPPKVHMHINYGVIDSQTSKSAVCNSWKRGSTVHQNWNWIPVNLEVDMR